MIDLHTHTFFSDGELSPAEIIRRAEVLGNQGIALTDHVDVSNLETVLPPILEAVTELNRHHRVKAMAGVEITHVPPELIAPLTNRARELGAHLVLVHGESIVEPVAPGTNLAAIEAGVDVLAHPGLLSSGDAARAAEKGVLLEISYRGGHCLGNGRVAAAAKEAGAGLVINTDAHSPRDLINLSQASEVGLGAGLTADDVAKSFGNAHALLVRALGV